MSVDLNAKSTEIISNFQSMKLKTAFFSQGGLVVPNLFGADRLPPLISFQPDAVILLVGDNKIVPSTSLVITD